MRKMDLKQHEEIAKDADRCGYFAPHYAANTPDVTIALLAYIRELQSLALEVAPDDASRSMVVAFIERGVIVP